MPSLPSSAPSAPSFLPSPLLGLGIFVLVFILVTGVYALYSYLARKLAERRSHISDVEKAGDASATPMKGRGKRAPQSPADVLVAARPGFSFRQSKTSEKKELVSLHKTLMAQKNAPGKAALLVVAPSPLRPFLEQQGMHRTLGLARVHQDRPLPGPSPLRSVYTAPEPVSVGVTLLFMNKPSPAPVSTPLPAPVTITVPTPVAASVAPPAPISVPVPVPESFDALAISQSRAATLLAAISRGSDGDSDSDSEHGDDNDSPIEFSFQYDAERGVWTTAFTHKLASTVSSPPSPSSPASVHITPSPVTTKGPVRAEPLVDSRMRNLNRSIQLKSPPRATSKRASRVKDVGIEKENSRISGTFLKSARTLVGRT
ncbi:hypothetical protein MVEN_02284200 [Mycena venus]|uniref:Uncharacterized protein n=1 Tax=Mycena venus TaxID=2733690 RepID=A0A8H7CGF3_9AGAR|nr:hypothetical protein MVEN_02284200 [Mycena venus]